MTTILQHGLTLGALDGHVSDLQGRHCVLLEASTDAKPKLPAFIPEDLDNPARAPLINAANQGCSSVIILSGIVLACRAREIASLLLRL